MGSLAQEDSPGDGGLGGNSRVSVIVARHMLLGGLLFPYALCKGSDCGDAKDAKEKAANDEADHDPD